MTCLSEPVGKLLGWNQIETVTSAILRPPVHGCDEGKLSATSAAACATVIQAALPRSSALLVAPTFGARAVTPNVAPLPINVPERSLPELSSRLVPLDS